MRAFEPRKKYSKQDDKGKKGGGKENKVLHTFCDPACKQCSIIHTGFLNDRHNCGELLFQRYLIWQTNS